MLIFEIFINVHIFLVFGFHPLNSFPMPLQRVNYWDFQAVSSASVKSISCYSLVKFQIGKLRKFAYEFGYFPWNLSDQGFSVQIIAVNTNCKLTFFIFFLPEYHLIILKTLSFVFKMSYDF